MHSSCDKFYKSGKACELRKAWVCEYVQWKIGFFKNWMTSAKHWM